MRVIITLNKNFTIVSDMHRLRIAKLASRILEVTGEATQTVDEGLPYTPNVGDTLFWTLDSGNDWKMKFDDENKNVFEIWHRYQINERSRANEFSVVNEAVKSLGGLLAYRLNGTMSVIINHS